MKYWPIKTPGQSKDLGLDWGPTLSKIGDPTIVDSSWTRLTGDVTISLPTLVDSRTTGARVSGGTAGTHSIFRNTVELSNGQILDEDVLIKVRA